jgi:thioredoxin-related protein
MARETHVDSAVIAALNEKFIPVRLEGRSHVDLAQKFNVRGVPTTLILSPQEQELRRLDGFQPPPQYLQGLVNAQ